MSSVPVFAGEVKSVDEKRMSADDCVAYALSNSAQVEEAEAKVDEWMAKLAEVESVYRPKIFGMAFVAPMFSVDFNATRPNATRRWKKLSDWGPYARAEVTLAQPLYTFGRAEAGQAAASHRAKVEEARVREMELMVSLEVRRYYYWYLYTKSLLPVLKKGAETLTSAQETAAEMYANGDGGVTQVDLNKLIYGQIELEKFVAQAETGSAMAMAALKHTMAWPASKPLLLTDKRLSKKLAELPELSAAIHHASMYRPEWAQLEHGQKATIALADAERLANAPVLFLGGQFMAAWAPTRDDTRNPYHFDPYNELFGGLALGLQFNIDPWAASAKAKGAEALEAQVVALRRFAKSGIPLRVKKAHSDLTQAKTISTLSKKSVKATRKWLAFAASAFAIGTGEAKDVLEGLGAYLQTKNSEYEALRDYFVAAAELSYATGE